MTILTNSQFKVLSEIAADIGQVFFASTVITPLISGLDIRNSPIVLSGMVGSFAFWLLSILFVRKIKL